MSRLLPVRGLFSAALLLTLSATGCSRPTRSTGPGRPLLHVESDGTVLDVTVQQERVTRSSGLRGAGRWFEWEDGSTECHVTARLQVSRSGHAVRGETLHLATDPPGRLFMDEATCRQRHSDITAESCAAEGRVAFQVDGVWRVVESFERRFWVMEHATDHGPPNCQAALTSAGSALHVVAQSHERGACEALLAHGALEAATRCVLDFDSFGVGDSLTRDSVGAAVQAAREGSEPPSTRIRWAALVAAGATPGEAQDMEAALYSVLLDGEPEFRANPVHVDLGLAFTPSRARRTAFVEAAVARCETNRFAPWQREALGTAAAGLGDAALSARVHTACGVDPATFDLRFPSHLEP